MGNDVGKPYGDDAVKIVARRPEVDPRDEDKLETAIFAAGCFWGVELAFQRVPGVARTTVGYINGHVDNPTYEDVCSGSTGHAEAVKVDFYPEAVSYMELLTVFWDRFDPTQRNRQGNDVGTQYRSGIYYLSEAQKAFAEASKEAEAQQYALPIATEVVPAETFWPAEKYHQQYLAKGGQCARKGDLTPIRCYG